MRDDHTAAELQDRLSRLEKKQERQHQLMEVLRNLSAEINLDSLLGHIMDMATEVVDADRSSLFLYDRARNELYSKIAQGLEVQEIRFSASQGIAGSVVRSGQTLNIPDAYEDPRFNREVDRRTGYRTRSLLCMPMISRRGETIGVLQVLNKKNAPAFDAEDEELLGTLAANAAVYIENATLYGQIEELFDAFVQVSIAAIDERDPCTSGHSNRVAAYTMNLAYLVHEDDGPAFGGIAFTRSQMRELRFASLLHDYGKIGVREHVLTKRNKLPDCAVDAICERLRRRSLERRLGAAESQLAGAAVDAEALGVEVDQYEVYEQLVKQVNIPGYLSDENLEALKAMRDVSLLTDEEFEQLSVRRGNLTAAEWEDMRSHVSRSYHILKKIPWPEDLRNLPEVAHAHHEKLDGSGYPLHLRGDEIPLGSRMMAIADIYDALTAADRPYKKAMAHSQACRILREEASREHLDPDLVELFVEGQAWNLQLRRHTTAVVPPPPAHAPAGVAD